MSLPRIQIFALLTLAPLMAGCWFFQKTYSPLPAIDPPPSTLGDVLEVMDQRWPEVDTLNAQGSMTLSGEGMRGKTSVRANVLHAEPGRLRLRASRSLVGTVFEVLQDGDSVRVYLNRDRMLFVGSIGDLQSLPGLVGGVEPLEIARALKIGETALRAIDRLEAAGQSPGETPFEGDTLTVQQIRPPAPGIAPRIERFTIRRRDGLIEKAVILEARSWTDWVEALTIDYRRWGEKDGRPYPRDLVILATDPPTRIRIEVDKAEFDLYLRPEVFQMTPARARAYPLSEMPDRLRDARE